MKVLPSHVIFLFTSAPVIQMRNEMYIFIFNLNQKVFLNFVIVINKFICFFTDADPLVGRADIDKEKISHDAAKQDEFFRTPKNDETTDGRIGLVIFSQRM